MIQYICKKYFTKYSLYFQSQCTTNKGDEVYSQFPLTCESDGSVVDDKHVCDGFEDCADGTDEELHFCKVSVFIYILFRRNRNRRAKQIVDYRVYNSLSRFRYVTSICYYCIVRPF